MLYPKNLFLLVLLVICNCACAQIITTFAGNGSFGFSGDGGPATNAKLAGVVCARRDGAGNLFIVDQFNNRIRKVSPAGIITTVAGIGTFSFSGDGGPATAAGIGMPRSVAPDGAGNIYIAEDSVYQVVTDSVDTGYSSLGSWIRKVDASGIITTVAGNGTLGNAGDNGPATSAQLHIVSDIALDAAGNIYISEFGNMSIRKVNTSGIISTIAGTGFPGYSGDGGPATAAMLNFLAGIAVDGAGNVYISDNGPDDVVRKIDAAGIISTIAGSGSGGYSGDGGPATAAQLQYPNGITLDGAGNIYIADQANARIRKVNPAGIITTIAGDGCTMRSGDGGPATAAGINPVGISLDGLGSMYISDGDVSVRKISGVNAGIALARPVLNENIEVWPEPNSGTFFVNISSPINEQAKITITNIIGQTIKELNAATNRDTELKLDARPGIYFITCVTTHSKLCGKIVVR